MSRLRALLVIATLSLVVTSCGSGDTVTEAPAATAKPSPMTYPLAGEVNPGKITNFPKPVSNVVPASGYIPKWTVRKAKARFTCAPAYSPVELMVNGTVEFQGSQIGHATHSVMNEDGEVLPKDYWISSSRLMPYGLLVYSTDDQDYDDDEVFVQPIDVESARSNDAQIVHISSADVKGDTIKTIIACYPR